MPSALRERDGNEVGPRGGTPSTGSVRRLGSAIGLVTITVLDLLALDDITTAGAWMPEIGFVIASIPALVTLAYFTFRRSSPRPELKEGASSDRLAP